MVSQAKKDALVAAFEQFVQRIAQSTGKLITSMEVDPETGQLNVTYNDDSVVAVGVVKGTDGEDGVDVIDVELYPDPLEPGNVFFQTTLSNGVILRTQNSISGYNGSSLADVTLEGNQLIFTLDDEEGTTLTPIPVAGLQAVSVVGTEIRDEGNGPELFWQLSDGSELASGIVEDLRGRGIESVYKQDGKLYITYDNAPGVPVEVGDAVGIASIALVNGQLTVTLDDSATPLELGSVVSITGATVVDGELLFSTNQPAPNDVINVGPVANLKGDPGVGIAAVELADNALVITLTDATELPPIPVSGITPISVIGARFDETEDELYLQLSNSTEIATGLSTQLRGRGISSASVDSAGKLYFQYTDNPGVDVEVGVVPAIINTDLVNGKLRVYYSTSPATPVEVGDVLGLVTLQQQANGTVIATLSNGSTQQVGTMRSISTVSIVSGILRVTYNDGTFINVGNVIGPAGENGLGIESTYITPGGDLVLVRTDNSELNAGFVRTTVQNLIGQTYRRTATAGQTVFDIAHEGDLLFIVNNQLIDDEDLELGITEEITYTGPALSEGDKVKVIVYSTEGPSPTGRGIFDIQLAQGSDTAYIVTLEDNSQFTIETNTPIPIEDLPAGISNIVVLPNGNLQVTLTNNNVIDAGPTSNAINTTNAYIDGNGDLHIVLTDATDINVGSVVSDLAITNAEIVNGDLVLTFNSGGTINAGPTGVYVTDATINGQDELIITLSDASTINAGVVRNPLLGSIYDFICFEGQFEFPVVHDGFEVVVYANAASLSKAAIDLTSTYVRLTTPRIDGDIVRIVLLSAGNVIATGIEGQNEAPNESYYGKDVSGAIGFHPLALTKFSQPYNFTAEASQTTFNVGHSGIDSVEVYVDGLLRHGGYTAPTNQIVFASGLSAGQQVRINLLKAPRTNGDLLIGNYSRVAYEVYSNGGTFNAGAYRIRALNKIDVDTIGLTLNANRIILPAGKYYVKGYAACLGVRQNHLRLFNQTHNSVALNGPAVFAPQTASAINTTAECHTPISGYFEVASQSSLVLQHKCAVSISSYGFGRGTAGGLWSALPNNDLGVPGRLVDLEIWKVE